MDSIDAIDDSIDELEKEEPVNDKAKKKKANSKRTNSSSK